MAGGEPALVGCSQTARKRPTINPEPCRLPRTLLCVRSNLQKRNRAGGAASGPGIVPNHMQAEMAPPDLRTLDQQPGVGGPRHGARRRERRSPRLCGQGRGQGGNMYLARWGYVCMFTHNPRMPCRERGMGSERALAMNENRGFEPRQTQFGSSLHRFPGMRL